MENTVKEFTQDSRGFSVVVGEFDAGKTAFLINLSVGKIQEEKKVLFLTASSRSMHSIVDRFRKCASSFNIDLSKENIRIMNIRALEFEEVIQNAIEKGFNPDLIILDAASSMNDELIKKIAIFSKVENIDFWVSAQTSRLGSFSRRIMEWAEFIVGLKPEEDEIDASIIKNRRGKPKSKKFSLDKINCQFSDWTK